jgi:hypothetical protein
MDPEAGVLSLAQNLDREMISSYGRQIYSIKRMESTWF